MLAVEVFIRKDIAPSGVDVVAIDVWVEVCEFTGANYNVKSRVTAVRLVLQIC